MLPPPEERYGRTHHALALLGTALMSITRRRAEYGPNFHFDAVQWVEEIAKLRSQIDDMIGLTAFVKEFGPVATTASSPKTATGVSVTSEPLPTN